MPETSAESHRTLRTLADRGGFPVTDSEIEAVAGAVQSARERLAAMRAIIAETEEPAGVFLEPAGLGQ